VFYVRWEEKAQRIASFFREKGWLTDFREVRFLAAGKHKTLQSGDFIAELTMAAHPAKA